MAERGTILREIRKTKREGESAARTDSEIARWRRTDSFYGQDVWLVLVAMQKIDKREREQLRDPRERAIERETLLEKLRSEGSYLR